MFFAESCVGGARFVRPTAASPWGPHVRDGGGPLLSPPSSVLLPPSFVSLLCALPASFLPPSPPCGPLPALGLWPPPGGWRPRQRPQASVLLPPGRVCPPSLPLFRSQLCSACFGVVFFILGSRRPPIPGLASAALGAAGAVCSQSFPRPASPTRGFTFTLQLRQFALPLLLPSPVFLPSLSRWPIRLGPPHLGRWSLFEVSSLGSCGFSVWVPPPAMFGERGLRTHEIIRSPAARPVVPLLLPLPSRTSLCAFELY